MLNGKQTATVPFSEIDPIFSQLRQTLDCSMIEAMQLVGYDSTSSIAKWRESGEAPRRFKYAVLGALADLQVKPKKEVIKQFDHQELSRLFAVLANIPIPDEQRKELIAKIAKELAS